MRVFGLGYVPRQGSMQEGGRPLETGYVVYKHSYGVVARYGISILNGENTCESSACGFENGKPN